MKMKLLLCILKNEHLGKLFKTIVKLSYFTEGYKNYFYNGPFNEQNNNGEIIKPIITTLNAVYNV